MNNSISNLKLYTSSGRIIDVAKLRKKAVGNASTGEVYKYGLKKVIKILAEPGTKEQYDVARLVQSLDLPNFYHIEEVLSNEFSGEKTYAGMISRFYKPMDIDLWTLPSTYLIEQVRKLRDSAIILGKNNIMIDDLNSTNILFGKDGLKVIDTDDYCLTDYDSTENNLVNIRSCIDYLLMLHYFKKNRSSDFNQFDLQARLSEVDPIDEEFHKTLSKYRTPLEWFEKRN